MATRQLPTHVIRCVFYLPVFLVIMTSRLPTVTSSEKSVEKYHAQVRVYVDSTAFSYWRQMSGKSKFEQYATEINSYFVEVQKVYESLEEFNTLAITFDVENITLMDTDVLKDPSTRSGITTCLYTFKNSIDAGYKKKPYDLAVLFTGYSLANRKAGNRKGVAFIDRVCTQDAVGIAQQEVTQNMAFVLAHEIGHIFGAEHDDDEYPDQSCYKKSGRLMNPTIQWFSPNRYSFSYCTNSYFEGSLERTKTSSTIRDCLSDGLDKTIKGQRLGSLIPPDEFCSRNRFGGKFILRSHYRQQNYRRICDYLSCVESNGKNPHTMKTLQGMKCGKNKVCNRGTCETSYEGSPFVLDSCPLGDQPRVGPNFDKSCSDIEPSACHLHTVDCCYTCNKTNPVFSMTADDVCRELAGEKFVMMRTSESEGDLLCAKLKCGASEDGRKFDRKTFKAPDGMACGKNKRCSNGKCTPAKNGNADIPDSCPFGDQDLQALGYKGTCQKYSLSAKSCKSWGKTCCKSCSN